MVNTKQCPRVLECHFEIAGNLGRASPNFPLGELEASLSTSNRDVKWLSVELVDYWLADASQNTRDLDVGCSALQAHFDLDRQVQSWKKLRT